MADDDNKKEPSEDASKKETPKDNEANTGKKWKEIVGDKYKSEEELAAAYKELEKKMGKQGEELGQAREFAEIVRPVLEAIREDPELFEKLDKKVREKTSGTPDNKAGADGNGKAAGQDDVRSVTSDLILEKFEADHGISSLQPEERTEMRRKIGDVVFELTGQTLKSIDLRRLGPVLNNAYILANKEKLVEKSKLEALAAARGVSEGGIPSIRSTSGSAEETLTPEEHRVATRMGLTDKQYLDGKKKSGR